MKTTIKLLVFILIFKNIGCGKSNESTFNVIEIKPTGEQTKIQLDTIGISFVFSLNNEEGQTSTIFNEGDNIIFSFSFKNLTHDTIEISNEFINNNLFRVYSVAGDQDMGKPWSGAWCYYNLGPKTIELAPSNVKILSCPWIKTETEQPVYPLCMEKSKDRLLKGEYYTFIDMDYHYTSKGQESIINKIKLKIDFKII